MNTESLQIARLLAFPEISIHYQDWLLKDKTLFNLSPSHAIILRAWLGIKKYSNSIEQNSDILLERSLEARSKSKKEYPTASQLAKALESIFDLAPKISSNPEGKLKSEESTRAWIERTILSQAAQSEPSILGNNDPWDNAVKDLEKLRLKKWISQNSEDDIAFPLSSYYINSKPRTPTGIEPFDLVELEGGAEEDTTLILSGETNIGKSHLGLYCLSSLSLRKQAVLLCSGEDSLETTRKRIFAHYLRKTAPEVLSMTEDQRRQAFRILYGHEDDPESLHYHISKNVAIASMSEGDFSPERVLEKIDKAEQKTQKKITAFMCDYLQKMNENNSSKNSRSMRDEELENTVNQIKDICQEKKSFGIVISQVPSHAAGGSQEFLSLKQAVARSYAATWGAHYVITMNRTAEETRRLASSSTDKRPRLNLFLCKNKDGPLGVCHALGFPDQARWEFYRDKISMEKSIELNNTQK
jgi:GTP-binding protein EngB required for normal cell division